MLDAERTSLPRSRPPDESRALHRKREANPDARCPRHPKKDLRPFVERPWESGWWCEQRRKYIFCYPPDETKSAIKVPMSPSGPRTMQNLRGAFAKAGLRL
jgi:hypothetical protein